MRHAGMFASQVTEKQGYFLTQEFNRRSRFGFGGGSEK